MYLACHQPFQQAPEMPIPLLNPPTGPTLLPPMPQDPPTLIDVSNVVAYNKQIGVSYGTHVFFHWFADFSFSSCYRGRYSHKEWCWSRGCLPSCHYFTQCRWWYVMHVFLKCALFDTPSVPAVAPPWFVPALAVGLAAGLAPLTHIAYTVSRNSLTKWYVDLTMSK